MFLMLSLNCRVIAEFDVELQVQSPLGGNITWGDSALFTCPVASRFSDELGGLYGPNGSYNATFGLIWATVQHCGSTRT